MEMLRLAMLSRLTSNPCPKISAQLVGWSKFQGWMSQLDSMLPCCGWPDCSLQLRLMAGN